MAILANAFIENLQRIFAEDALLLKREDCWAYGFDNSRGHVLPLAVLLPDRHQQVVESVNACNRFQIPLTTRGRGTGTTGAAIPTPGGVVLSTERLQKITAVSPENRYLTAEPGVTNQSIQEAAARHGFFWPPDPTSAAYCSLGGNLAFNSSGPRAVKYGTCRDNTLALRAVTGTGQTIHTGERTSKGVVGYDLTRLLIGSEGTLAIITEATLKLTPLPECKKTLRAIYGSLSGATEAVTRIMAQAIVPCALEFIDANALTLIRQHNQTDIPASAQALLMIEVDGPEAGIDYAADLLAQAAANKDMLELHVAANATESQALWQTRKALAPTLRKLAPKKINEDVVVPVTEIPRLISALEQLARKYDLTIVNFGHAGNGNIHVNILFDPAQGEQQNNALRCLDEMFNLVLSLNGTLSGEHGVGLEKRDFIDRELESTTLQLMRQIKVQFDPNLILNPDKIFPG